MNTTLLKYLVSASGMTQKDIATAIGLSQQRFNFYVTGKREPDTDTLCTLADYFGVTVDYLLGRDAVPAPEEAKTAPSEKDEALLDVFHKLNDEGKEQLLDFADSLVRSGKFGEKDSKTKVV